NVVIVKQRLLLFVPEGQFFPSAVMLVVVFSELGRVKFDGVAPEIVIPLPTEKPLGKLPVAVTVIAVVLPEVEVRVIEAMVAVVWVVASFTVPPLPGETGLSEIVYLNWLALSTVML